MHAFVVRASNYDKFPEVIVPCGQSVAWRGWDAIGTRLGEALQVAMSRGAKPIVAIECYPGVFQDEIEQGLRTIRLQVVWVDTRGAFRTPEDIDRLVAPDLGGNDPLFGFLTRLDYEDFLSDAAADYIRQQVQRSTGVIVIIGPAATLLAPPASVLVYADLPRWEAQRRQRRNEVGNLGVENHTLKASLKYKRSYFVDWRVADRLKQQTLPRWDFVLDTCITNDPKMVAGDAFRRGLAHCVTRPFRVVPFFDPGPWGGQWMKEICDLDRSQPNFGWCFDCVPEENSLLLKFGNVRVEVPAIDLVLAQPRPLLGEPAYGRFGPEFPIRFDFLDTMGGGNLSLQVHPPTGYIQARFGMHYTQDESYYLLDAKAGAVVFLTHKSGVASAAMFRNLEEAQANGATFDDEAFVARFPAKKHDHFLIPAGTLHASGRDCMVLEISATPYIFTFKLWDWNRPGLDGKPRPINIDHGRASICWERDEDYARARLINQIVSLKSGDGWREERTGLHDAEFIETRRHWFTDVTPHHTGGASGGSVNVLNLVQGEEALVDSPTDAFEPFVVHYAETFILPAAVGSYRLRPIGRARGSECATIKAFIRGQAPAYTGNM